MTVENVPTGTFLQRKNMKRILIFSALLFCTAYSFAQGARIDDTSTTTGAGHTVVALPGSKITLCQYPAKGQAHPNGDHHEGDADPGGDPVPCPTEETRDAVPRRVPVAFLP